MMDAPDRPPAIECLQPGSPSVAHEFRDDAILGTRLFLSIVAPDAQVALAAARAARAEIDRLDGVLNTRRPDSELSLLNGSAVRAVSRDLFTVVEAAEAWRNATSGAFSGRLGRMIDAWATTTSTLPDPGRLQDLAAEAAAAHVELDLASRTISRPDSVRFALDALAKGYIVDRALAAIRATEGVCGALVDIGGDIAAWGQGPRSGGWCVGLPDPRTPVDNAPLFDAVRLENAAIATSGRGPRDRIVAGRRISPTLDPRNGQPVFHSVSASVVASTAMEADALASALLVAGPAAGLTPSTPTWRMDLEGVVDRSSAWDGIRLAPQLLQVQAPASPQKLEWHKDWQALATFTAPRRQLIRDPGFRSPYLAMWLTTPDNKPVRTLLLIGTRAEWQKDNFIWWGLNRARATRFVSTRSMSTSGSGVYNVFWDGLDDDNRYVAPGTYVLHVETSRERGQHTHRSLSLDFSRAERFRQEIPKSEEAGGLVVTFDRY